MTKDSKRKSNYKIYRVTPDKERNKWKIKADDAERAIGYYNTKAEALEKARDLKSKNENVKISVHRKDGKIQEYI